MNLIKQIKDTLEQRFGKVEIYFGISEANLDISFNQAQSYNVWGRNLLNYQSLTDKQLVDLISKMPFYWQECDELGLSYNYDCSTI